MAASKIDVVVDRCLDAAGPAVLDGFDLSAREAEEVARRLGKKDVVARIIDGQHIKNKDELLRVLAAVFHLPAYFGKNWDALIDCLSDISWLPARGYVAILLNADALQAAEPKTYKAFLKVCQDVADRWAADQSNTIFKLICCTKAKNP